MIFYNFLDNFLPTGKKLRKVLFPSKIAWNLYTFRNWKWRQLNYPCRQRVLKSLANLAKISDSDLRNYPGNRKTFRLADFPNIVQQVRIFLADFRKYPTTILLPKHCVPNREILSDKWNSQNITIQNKPLSMIPYNSFAVKTNGEFFHERNANKSWLNWFRQTFPYQFNFLTYFVTSLLNKNHQIWSRPSRNAAKMTFALTWCTSRTYSLHVQP